MGRFARENDFDSVVVAMVDAVANAEGAWPIPKDRAIALVKGIIGAESSFNPQATRGEPQIGDASLGLMQILLSTARRVTGNPGLEASALYNPANNVFIGAKLLHGLARQTGNEAAAVSAYNGGYRPHLGFGALRTRSTPRVCLQWKPTAPADGRSIDHDCAIIGSTAVGTFSNQTYVDKVRSYTDYFFRNPPASGNVRPAEEEVPGTHEVNVPLVAGLGAALLGLLLLRRKRGR